MMPESPIEEQTDEEILDINLNQVVAPVNSLPENDKRSACVTRLSRKVRFTIDTGAKRNALTTDKNHTTNAEFERVNTVQESVLGGKTAEALSLIVRDDAPSLPAALREFPQLARTTGTLPHKYTVG